MLPKALLAGLLTVLLASGAAALEPIVIKGSKFFYKNGTQFFIKGIAYQQHPKATASFRDPLADPDSCRRDVPLLAELGTNTIRTYAIDPTADHSACMALLEDAGIYVISDLGEPSLSIQTDAPEWDLALFQRYKKVVDELGRYSNVIGFFAGNEVTTNRSNTNASAYVKAAVRDTKAYIKEKGKNLYVGYAGNDNADIRRDIAHYFNCGDQREAIDFWGYNIYEWCGDSSLKASGYEKQIEFFSNYSVPVFFAEYGCNEGKDGAEGRVFQETTAIYEKPMTDVFSGGVVYMYFQERNDYGLVEVDGSNPTRMKNFKALADRISKVNPTLLNMSDYKPTNTPQTCPRVSDTWEVPSPDLPPTPDEKLCECMYAQLTCVPAPGLDVKHYAGIFDSICQISGLIINDPMSGFCGGIRGEVMTRRYGAWSMCGSKQKLGFVLEEHYRQMYKNPKACDFGGKAVRTDFEEVSKECKERLREVSGKVGTGAWLDGARALRVGAGVGLGGIGAVVLAMLL